MIAAPVSTRGDDPGGAASNPGWLKQARWVAVVVPAIPFVLAGAVLFARGNTVMGAMLCAFAASVSPLLALRWWCERWVGRISESRMTVGQDTPPLVIEPTTLGASFFDDVELQALCSICLRCLAESPDERETPHADPSCFSVWGLDCGHKFHSSCLRVWLSRHRTCPLCRTPVRHVQEAFALPSGEGDAG